MAGIRCDIAGVVAVELEHGKCLARTVQARRGQVVRLFDIAWRKSAIGPRSDLVRRSLRDYCRIKRYGVRVPNGRVIEPDDSGDMSRERCRDCGVVAWREELPSPIVSEALFLHAE